MARNVTVGTITTRIREAADMENTDFVTTTEIERGISADYAELYELLVESGLSFFRSTQTIETEADEDPTSQYDLPADYYATVRVDHVPSANTYRPLQKVMPHELHLVDVNQTGVAGFYEIVGSSLMLYPRPAGTQTYRHIYIPAPPELSGPSTNVDGVAGWEEFLVLKGAIRCLQKEESSATHLERKLALITDRIEKARLNRDLLANNRVVDVEEDRYLDASDLWWGRR